MNTSLGSIVWKDSGYTVSGQCGRGLADSIPEPVSSPWGEVQSAVFLGSYPDGFAWLVSTASHGGIYLSPGLNEKVPGVFQDAAKYGCGRRGWYEEDCEVLIVGYFLPCLDWEQMVDDLGPWLRACRVGVESMYTSVLKAYQQSIA